VGPALHVWAAGGVPQVTPLETHHLSKFERVEPKVPSTDFGGGIRWGRSGRGFDGGGASLEEKQTRPESQRSVRNMGTPLLPLHWKNYPQQIVWGKLWGI